MVCAVVLKRKLFFDILCDVGIFRIQTPSSQIEHFLIYAGATKLPVPNTVKNWIDTERSVNTKRYFGTKYFSGNVKLFKKIRKEPKYRLIQLQEKFKNYKEYFAYIDVNTTDLDVFCKSIVNEFSGFVGLNFPIW